MALPLKDARWSQLRSSYGGIGDVVSWLAEAYGEKGLPEGRLGDIINEVQHQGGTSTAMYAVATHFIELAGAATPKDALTLLTHAGLIYSSSAGAGAVQCPEFLREEFVASAPLGAKMLAPLLPLATDFDSYKYAVAGLAGFIGLHRFADFLDGLDYYEGEFYHLWIDGVFPARE
jgi:hypothetical protein